HYLLATSATDWLGISHFQTEERAPLEANSLDLTDVRLKNSIAQTGRLLVIGCGPGEGEGECQLLERLLQETREAGTKIDYLALDTSPTLLYTHVDRLKEQLFDSGRRLRCAAVPADFEQLQGAIDRAKPLWGA